MITQHEADSLSEDFIKALTDKTFYQVDASKEYTKLIACNYYQLFDWRVINLAIVNRWSKSGLKRIKTMAWKRYLNGP